MKTLKLFVLGIITISITQACNTEPKTADTENRHRPQSFELNNIRDTINMLYADSSKEGHWIVQNWTAGGGRIKTEEGYYKNNKKEGYWKFYNKDGSLKDSVEYKNDAIIAK